MAGLFSMQAPAPTSDAGEDDMSLDDFSDDALEPAEDSEDADLGAGPFDAYADTVLDAEASPEDRKAALREAIMTLIEENRL